ncbi:carbonic anhydrase [Kibdelosporangium lantanae]
MQSFIDHARGFPAAIADRRAQFAELANGQEPQALFVSCSDSRVMPSLFTGAQPGEVFELRTAGNIIPPYQPSAVCAVGATLEFALQALAVPDIVVCGHSHCGAVQGLLRRDKVRRMPLVRDWLTRAGHRENTETDLRTAIQRHLLLQVDHLRTYPIVATAIAEGRLRLHAWYYTVETGEVLAHDPATATFHPL